ncbi:MAG: hypothetical protein QOE58_560 [Actinomycetota bacterium]|jgi:hypothetical protein|nr:hypothetical protein [Actinomycetota bacterium]
MNHPAYGTTLAPSPNSAAGAAGGRVLAAHSLSLVVGPTARSDGLGVRHRVRRLAPHGGPVSVGTARPLPPVWRRGGWPGTGEGRADRPTEDRLRPWPWCPVQQAPCECARKTPTEAGASAFYNDRGLTRREGKPPDAGPNGIGRQQLLDLAPLQRSLIANFTFTTRRSGSTRRRSRYASIAAARARHSSRSAIPAVGSRSDVRHAEAGTPRHLGRVRPGVWSLDL